MLIRRVCNEKELLTAAALTLLLCGCSHKTEVRDKGFVRSIGCDGKENKTVSVRLYGEKDVLSGNGETIFTAIENAETSQGKTLFTGHLELLALSPGNIREMLTVMMQNNRISPSCSLLMIPENASGTIESYEETELTDLIESGCRKGKIKTKHKRRFKRSFRRRRYGRRSCAKQQQANNGRY